jgi:hypothetical protein
MTPDVASYRAKQATERGKIIDVGQSATRRDFTPPFTSQPNFIEERVLLNIIPA